MAAGNRQHRALAILLAVVAAAALIVAAFGPRWLTGASNRDGFGLRTVELCTDDCKTMTNFKLVEVINQEREEMAAVNQTLARQAQLALDRKPWAGFSVVGLITFTACLLAAAGLLVGAVLAASRRRLELPIMPTTVAVLGVLLAIINGCIFVATKPIARRLDSMGVGWTFFVFGVGVVTALMAVFPLNRLIRPIDDELGEASATSSWGASREDQ